jgi:hypothetical protein
LGEWRNGSVLVFVVAVVVVFIFVLPKPRIACHDRIFHPGNFLPYEFKESFKRFNKITV